MNGGASRQEILNKLEQGIDLGAYEEGVRYNHRKVKGQLVELASKLKVVIVDVKFSIWVWYAAWAVCGAMLML